MVGIERWNFEMKNGQMGGYKEGIEEFDSKIGSNITNNGKFNENISPKGQNLKLILNNLFLIIIYERNHDDGVFRNRKDL